MVASEINLCETRAVAMDTEDEERENGRGARKTLSIRAEVGAAFKRVCKSKRVGRSMDDTATRLIEWFNRQREFIRTAVTLDVDEGMEHAYITALRELADDLEKKSTGEEVTSPEAEPGPEESPSVPNGEGSRG